MEYATREQAQKAINDLSNMNLMGRLIYVREVRCRSHGLMTPANAIMQDRETEPRFTGAPPARGGFDGGYGAPRGGYGGGGYGGGMRGGMGMGGGGGGGMPGNQVFINNVCSLASTSG